MSDSGDEGRLPPMSEPGGVQPAGPARQPPQIEGYDATDLLGQGGMGTVWRAVQQSTGRQVALKVLGRAAFGSDREQRRFEREVELAARLEHPHIARVYDSGLYYSMYYYAMELIDGVPLDEYVQQNGLNRQQVLSLVRDVCRAVQHAHQRGVIHRDLKPSNVLVTGDGQPHIVDFGLAKAVLDEGPALTVSLGGDVVGTPAYMSPEQAAGKPIEADTRSDVYSLGVVLYRLLTGTSPHDLTGTRYDVLRRIAEEEARRPRGMAKDVDGELEALLLKALAHEPDERYGSAGDLADDIDRYLTGEPLAARRPTTAYFLRKRLRKYRGRVAVAALVSVSLVGLAVWSYVNIAQARDEARKEADRATSLSTLFDDTIETIGRAGGHGREVAAHDVFDGVGRQVRRGFSGQPLTEAAMHQRLGTSYVMLGDYDKAHKHFSAALELREGILGRDDPSALESMHGLANTQRLQKKALEAERLLTLVVTRRRKVLGEDHPDTLSAVNDLAKSLFGGDKKAESEDLARQTLEMSRRALGEDDPTTLVFMADLAKILWGRGNLAEAESLYRQVLEARQRVLGENHQDTLSSMDDLANTLWALGRRDEALRLYKTAAETRERVLGEDHAATVKSLTAVANALIKMGRRAEAEPLHERVLELRQRAANRWMAEALASMNEVANNYCHRRRYAEAEELHREGLRLGERFLGKEHPPVLEFKSNLATDLYQQRRFRQAVALYREVLEVRVRVLGKRHPDTLLSMLNLANALFGDKEHVEAEFLYKEILEIGNDVTGNRVPHILRRALKSLVVVLRVQGKEAEAEGVRKRYEEFVPLPIEEADETMVVEPDGG